MENKGTSSADTSLAFMEGFSTPDYGCTHNWKGYFWQGFAFTSEVMYSAVTVAGSTIVSGSVAQFVGADSIGVVIDLTDNFLFRFTTTY
jgi:hypothetical protein